MDLSNLGGAEFIGACTGLNLAFASWTNFQDKIRYAERKYADRLRSAVLTLTDSGEHRIEKLCLCLIMKPLARANKALWYFCYVMAVLAAIAGMAGLYFNSGCPWDAFLLLPTVLYLGWTYFALFILLVWIAVLRRFFGFVTSAQMEQQLDALVASEANSATTLSNPPQE